MIRLALAAAFAVVLTAVPARAQRDLDRDLDTVLVHYTLTMPKVDAWQRATLAMGRALKGQTRDYEKAAQSAKTEDLVAFYDKTPAARRAIRDARLSTREYVTISLVLMQSIMAESVMREAPNAEVPKNMNPANLSFVRANREEVMRRLSAVNAPGGGQ